MHISAGLSGNALAALDLSPTFATSFQIRRAETRTLFLQFRAISTCFVFQVLSAM